MNVSRTSVVVAVALLACSTHALAQTGGCDAKRQEIEQELAYAKAHGNANRVKGLETALDNMKANCTDASLRKSSQRKVDAAKKKVAEREADLQKAQADGKSPKKVADRQRKLDEAHADLEKALIEASK